MRIESCEDLFENLKATWRYLTTDWLVMINLDSDRVERCTTVKEWEIIQNSFNSFEGNGFINRKKQISCQREALILSAMGYITSFSAISNVYEPRESVIKLLDEGLEMFFNKGKDYKDIVEQKRRLLGFT